MDQFTADVKYTAWEEKLSSTDDAQGTARFRTVDAGDHFWSDPAKKAELLQAVDTWLAEVQ